MPAGYLNRLKEFCLTLRAIFLVFFYDEAIFPNFQSNQNNRFSNLFANLCCIFHGILHLFCWRIFIKQVVWRLAHRPAFGRFLVIFAMSTIGIVVLSIYVCLLPLRLSRWLTSENGNSELYWLLFHAVFGHIVLANLAFHFFCGVQRDPGTVPQPLPLSIPRTMCKHCQLARPLRAHHCSVCKKCILVMDHHCPWLNNCVGLHTHRHFYLFLVYISIGVIYLCSTSWNDYMQHSRAIWMQYNSTSACIDDFVLCANAFVHRMIEALYGASLVLLFFSIFLLLWHGRLITRGETSIEQYQNQRLAKKMARRNLVFRNRFDFGPCGNWLQFLGLSDLTDVKIVAENKIAAFWILVKVTFRRIIIPTYHNPCDCDGLTFATSTTSIQSVLEDLSGLSNEK